MLDLVEKVEQTEQERVDFLVMNLVADMVVEEEVVQISMPVLQELLVDLMVVVEVVVLLLQQVVLLLVQDIKVSSQSTITHVDHYLRILQPQQISIYQ